METYLPIIVLGVLLIVVLFFFLKHQQQNKRDIEGLMTQTSELKTELELKKRDLSTTQNKIEVLEATLKPFEEIKTSKAKLEIEYANLLQEKNKFERENISLKKSEEARIEEHKRSIDATVTLQETMKSERKKMVDDLVEKEREEFEKLKETWRNHEKDVEQHIRLICKNHIIKYVEQNDFPHGGTKPDNVIEILDQLIVFDAKSPSNDDLNNFPKYIRTQTESLKKYAKHDEVKNDLFLVIPSNTLHVIKEFTYNIGDYNVFIISKDSLEPIILSLKKIEEYEFADKLSPEDRDGICRIIGKFAHSTKRKIQIEQFFAEEFLDILQKCKTQLPREILEKVIDFENAEKLNPPMEKRRKPILTKDLEDKKNEIKKEFELRDIPEIQASIEFKKSGE